jgi:hypothetical protein
MYACARQAPLQCHGFAVHTLPLTPVYATTHARYFDTRQELPHKRLNAAYIAGPERIPQLAKELACAIPILPQPQALPPSKQTGLNDHDAPFKLARIAAADHCLDFPYLPELSLDLSAVLAPAPDALIGP